MNQVLEEIICEKTKATAVIRVESVQILWSGYGEIKRYHLEGGLHLSVIVKHIQPPNQVNHPRGWNTSFSHERKIKSYLVEKNWYDHLIRFPIQTSGIPRCYHSKAIGHEILLILEDLNASGFDLRLDPITVTLDDAKNCLKWLANFHAAFLGKEIGGLWPIGTYWHLETRPDEWSQMENQILKEAALEIDKTLNHAKFQTVIHGDAKLANFCFDRHGGVAAVDFQYVGRGCAMKDVAYFISSCFDEVECEKYHEELLDLYFDVLKDSIDDKSQFTALEKEWRHLYKYAWADFCRFLDGWSPGHWKMHAYSNKLTNQVIEEIKG